MQEVPFQRVFSSRCFGHELCFPSNGVRDVVCAATLLMPAVFVDWCKSKGRFVWAGQAGWLRSTPLVGVREKNQAEFPPI